MAQDMTKGEITPQLVRFTIPLVLGNMFQLLYNATDSVIVGKYVGKEALAAVGTSNPIMTLAILFISGICIGAGVIMGTYYGGKEYEKLQRQISSTLIGGVAFSILLSIVCIVCAPVFLKIIQVKTSVMTEAVSYLRIIFCGLVFTFVYNFYANTLRALGDSKSPLYFLMISAVLNVFGDLFFIIVLDWGSMGCGIATVISEGISCLLCGIYIKLKVKMLCLGRKWLVFDWELFKKTVSYGITSAMQQATVQLGKIGIQTIVNTMDVATMAAFTAVNRVDDFAYIPQQNIAHGMSSFMAQNKGAGKKERVIKGFKCGMLLELFYGIIICGVCLIFARPIMTLFSEDKAVVELGVRYLRIIAIIYILPAMTNGIQGYFRGIGRLKVTLLSSFTNMGVRLLAAVPLVFVLGMKIEALPISYMIGWIGMLVVELPILYKEIKGKGM